MEERCSFQWVLILVASFCILTSLENVTFPHVQNSDVRNQSSAHSNYITCNHSLEGR